MPQHPHTGVTFNNESKQQMSERRVFFILLVYLPLYFLYLFFPACFLSALYSYIIVSKCFPILLVCFFSTDFLFFLEPFPLTLQPQSLTFPCWLSAHLHITMSNHLTFPVGFFSTRKRWDPLAMRSTGSKG